ncbi:hypothetical protein HC891_05235 [Candidatus Gracilibacteria bacterium]|nr:hypothetical protein [Candidatus Gracilibacteria bacterium]
MTSQRERGITRLRELLNDPHATKAAIADAYVHLLSTTICDLGRQGYGRDGRGAVEIDLRGLDLRTARGNLPILYYPLDEAGDDWPEEVFAELAAYTPQREAVAILFYDGGPPQIYVLEEAGRTEVQSQ